MPEILDGTQFQDYLAALRAEDAAQCARMATKFLIADVDLKSLDELLFRRSQFQVVGDLCEYLRAAENLNADIDRRGVKAAAWGYQLFMASSPARAAFPAHGSTPAPSFTCSWWYRKTRYLPENFVAHLLLIDDDEQYRAMLTLDTHRVTIASDGEEGLRLAAQVKPDFITTDILMPNKDGIETIMALNQGGNEIPIIAISGGRRFISTDFNLQSAALVGVRATLAKPFKRADWRQAVVLALSS